MLTPALPAQPLAALASAAVTHSSGSILVTGPDPALSYACARHVANDDVRDATGRDDVDVHAHAPQGTTWTADELAQHVLTPAHTRPLVRAHIIIGDTHLLPTLLADRLLKTLEEPSEDILYWLITPRPDLLPATLRSRVTATIHLAPRAPEAQLQDLVDAGADTHTAREAVTLAGPDALLAHAVAHHPEALPALVTFHAAAHSLATAHVTQQEAHRTAHAIATLAQHLEPAPRTRPKISTGDPRRSWAALNPGQRSAARRLLANLIDRTEELLTIPLTSHETNHVDHLYAALDAARTRQAMNTAGPHILEALAAATAAR